MSAELTGAITSVRGAHDDDNDSDDDDDVFIRSPPRPTCPPSSPSMLKVSSEDSTVEENIICLSGYYGILRPSGAWGNF